MSSDYGSVKSKKLSFKGDSKRKKSKGSGKRKAEGDEPVEGEKKALIHAWTPVDALGDFDGPLYLLHFSGHNLTTDDTTHRILCPRAPESEGEGGPMPTDVLQVWVGKRIDASGTVCFRAATDMYLSADKLGVVSVNKEAVGQLETWTPVIRDEGIALQSFYNKFLSYDEDTGTLRADAESIGLREIWPIKCQTDRKHQSVKKARVAEKSIRDLEIESIKKNQTWGGGKVITGEKSLRELKRAKQEGNLSGLLLDRREKVKSDKFCK